MKRISGLFLSVKTGFWNVYFGTEHHENHLIMVVWFSEMRLVSNLLWALGCHPLVVRGWRHSFYCSVQIPRSVGRLMAVLQPRVHKRGSLIRPKPWFHLSSKQQKHKHDSKKTSYNEIIMLKGKFSHKWKFCHSHSKPVLLSFFYETPKKISVFFLFCFSQWGASF